MKIAFDAKRAFHNRTGLGNYSRTLISGLMRHFPENQFVLFDTPKLLDLPYFIRSLQESGADFEIWRTSNLSRNWGWGGEAKKKKADIYHGLSNEIPFDLKRGKVKSVATIHDLIFKRFPQNYKPLDRWIYQQKTQHLARHADLILATSMQTKADLEEFYPACTGRVQVVYQDCDPAFHFRRRPEAIARMLYKFDLVERPYILCVSKLEQRKNHLRLVQAFEKIMHQIPEDLVLVGGRGDAADPVLNQLERFQGRLRWLGKVETDDLVNLYDGSSFTAYPSVFEGFGIPLLESIRRGKAILSSEGSCFGEIAGSAALYANPESVEELAQCLLSLSSHADLRQKLELAAAQECLRFQPEKLEAEVMAWYQNI
jgi:glycosyltransferase involved in cell wall biosynthesis